MLVVSNVGVVSIKDVAYGEIANDKDTIAARIDTGKSTEDVVRSYFNDIPVMVQIARCESHFRQTNPDGSVLHGGVDPADTGVMQINERYHAAKATKLGLDLTNLHDNLVYARMLYDKEGTKPWASSKSCWQQTIAMR